MKDSEITNETPIAFLTVGQLVSVLNRVIQKEQSQVKITMPEIIGLKSVCELTGYSKAAIYQRTSKGLIPHFRREGRLLFRRDEIINWLTEHRVETQEEYMRRLNAKLLKRKGRTL